MKFVLVLLAILFVGISCAQDAGTPGSAEHSHSHEHSHGSHEHSHAHAHSHSHAHRHSHERAHSHGSHERVEQSSKPAKPQNNAAPTSNKQGHAHKHEHDHGHEHEHGHGHEHEHGHGHGHEHGHAHGLEHFLTQYSDLIDKYTFGYAKYAAEWAQKVQPKFASAPKWAQAMMAVLLISLAPNLMMLVLPFGTAGNSSTFRRLSLAFASGSLLGDAFLHLIPHSLAEAKSKLLHKVESGLADAHSHSHDDLSVDEEVSVRVGLFVLFGILIFLLVERLIRLFSGSHEHAHSHTAGQSHSGESHAHGAAAKQDAATSKSKRTKDDHQHSQKASHSDASAASKLTIAAVLNLIADVSHNFTDGLAIGAAFSANFALGISTTASMFFHELPHELGDIAILIEGGFSKWRACALQFITAFGAFGGCLFAFVLEGTRFDELILPLTAGGFIYVSTAGVLPELLSSEEKEGAAGRDRRSRLGSFFGSLAELTCAFAGIAVMYGMCALDVHAH